MVTSSGLQAPEAKSQSVLARACGVPASILYTGAIFKIAFGILSHSWAPQNLTIYGPRAAKSYE
eukprot:839088-Pelagomonas_calceolata.AAC.4